MVAGWFGKSSALLFLVFIGFIVGCDPFTDIPRYACAHGAAFDGYATAAGMERCVSCQDGYSLVDRRCIANYYTCAHGDADESAASSIRERCVRCDTGYYIAEETCASSELEDILYANETSVGDNFGYSLDAEDTALIVGAFRENSAGTDSGKAYIFRNNGGQWVEEASLAAADAASNQRFGYSVAISDEWAVVGAPNNNDSVSQSGAAYIFRRENSSWEQHAKLTSPNASEKDAFGVSVALSGNWALIGAPGDDSSETDGGSTYLYALDGEEWSLYQTMTPLTHSEGDLFGFSVDIHGDWILIGAYGSDDGGDSSGAAYFFSAQAERWTQQHKLVAPDAEAEHYFGYSLNLSDTWAIVSAYNDSEKNSGAGAAYLYRKESGTWVYNQKIYDVLLDETTSYGFSVAIVEDYALVGSAFNGYFGNIGHVGLFAHVDDQWVQYATFQPEEEQQNYFGFSLAATDNHFFFGSIFGDGLLSTSGVVYYREY